MRTRAVVLFGLAAGLVSAPGVGTAAPVPKHLLKEPQSDRARLQGKWKVEALKVDGKVRQNPAAMTVEFHGDEYVATTGATGRKTVAAVKYGIGGTREVHLTGTKLLGPNGGAVGKGATRDRAYGYAFDEDKLLLAYGTRANAPAPDPLKRDPEAGSVVVMELTRMTEK